MSQEHIECEQTFIQENILNIYKKSESVDFELCHISLPFPFIVQPCGSEQESVESGVVKNT